MFKQYFVYFIERDTGEGHNAILTCPFWHSLDIDEIQSDIKEQIGKTVFVKNMQRL